MTIEITKEEIVELNMKIVKEFGGSIGLHNESNLDFVLAKVRNAKNIFKKAAELMYGINQGHPFLDGNKRTAFETSKIFLLVNRIQLNVDEKEAEEFMVEMSQPEKLSIKEVEIGIKEHSGKHGKEEV